MYLTSDDKVAIQELSTRYANAMDKGDADAWLDTWDDAGVWEGGLGRYEGKAELRKLLCDLGARIQGKRHVMTNFVIDGDHVEARQTCYLLVFDRITEPLGDRRVYGYREEGRRGLEVHTSISKTRPELPPLSHRMAFNLSAVYPFQCSRRHRTSSSMCPCFFEFRSKIGEQHI